MADHKEPPLTTAPLHADVVGNEIVLHGGSVVSVSLSWEAALETGINLINAAMKLRD